MPFKAEVLKHIAGRLPALVPAALLLLFAVGDPLRFEELKLKGFDLEQQIVPRQEAPNLPVVIVAVDAASLVPPYGQ